MKLTIIQIFSMFSIRNFHKVWAIYTLCFNLIPSLTLYFKLVKKSSLGSLLWSLFWSLLGSLLGLLLLGLLLGSLLGSILIVFSDSSLLLLFLGDYVNSSRIFISLLTLFFIDSIVFLS